MLPITSPLARRDGSKSELRQRGGKEWLCDSCGFSHHGTLSPGEDCLESKIKNAAAKNRLGYGNGDRSGYPTLFGWEKEKHLAYFTTGHRLSSVTRASSRSKCSSRSKRSNRRPRSETLVNRSVESGYMASAVPNLQVRKFLEKYE
jgi:hypothetical protein